MAQPYQEIVLCDNLAITDVLTHDPSTDAAIAVADIHPYQMVALKIDNTTNQSVRVQFKGNIGRSGVALATTALVRPDDLGSPITVLTADSETRTLPWYDKTPTIYPEITALVAPTSGSVRIVAICQGLMEGL